MAERNVLSKMDELKTYAVLLSGGVGSRMKSSANCPKQYLSVAGKPIYIYALLEFEKCTSVDGIVIVANNSWVSAIKDDIKRFGITKVAGFAENGETRQHSIFSGLKALDGIANENDIVILHDAARPLVDMELINACIEKNRECDGVLPYITVKDTVYESLDGKTVSKLLKRSTLCAGQAPESFVYGKYYNAHLKYSEDELARFSGSTEIAIANGMNVCLIPGSERNFKITTDEDLKKLEMFLEKEE